MFVNGSSRTTDGGTNNLTFRNDAGELILGNTASLTHLPGLTEGTIRARTLVTSYQDSISNVGGCLTGGDNAYDAWIYNFYDSASWGIYSRNIDSTLTVNGFGLPSNSTAFIGGGSLRAYVAHNDGRICASGGFLIDGESTATNQAKGITWSGYDKENTNDRSDVAGIIQQKLSETAIPIIRIDSLTINPRQNTNIWQHALGRDLGDRIKVNITNLYINCINHSCYSLFNLFYRKPLHPAFIFGYASSKS